MLNGKHENVIKIHANVKHRLQCIVESECGKAFPLERALKNEKIILQEKFQVQINLNNKINFE